MLLVLQTVFGFREKGSGRAKLSRELRLFEVWGKGVAIRGRRGEEEEEVGRGFSEIYSGARRRLGYSRDVACDYEYYYEP